MFIKSRKCRKSCIMQVLMFVSIVILILLVRRLYTAMHGYMPTRPVEQANRDFAKYLNRYKFNYWKNTTVKYILLWTPFFGDWSWVDDAERAMNSCAAKCIVIRDKGQVENSDAVLFHASDLWKHKGLLGTIMNFDTALPITRSPNQIWAVLSLEPIVYMWGNMKKNAFNWTIHYRRESTIYNPFTYWRKMTPEELKSSPKPKSNVSYFKEKTGFATTLISNCMDQASRYKIIRELQKYIDLDYFGACSGKTPCPAGVPTEECGQKFLKHYKFYLAFENSYCRDYVSEKFWNALSRYQIPIIAAPNYNLELLPPNSYLNVFDFPSIKELANRMKEIAKNETIYNSFFDWMSFYKTDMESFYCKVCKELHANRPAQSYMDFEAWIEDDMCYKSSAWSLVSGFIERALFYVGLI